MYSVYKYGIPGVLAQYFVLKRLSQYLLAGSEK
jgi:hypothetical protein